MMGLVLGNYVLKEILNDFLSGCTRDQRLTHPEYELIPEGSVVDPR